MKSRNTRVQLAIIIIITELFSTAFISYTHKETSRFFFPIKGTESPDICVKMLGVQTKFRQKNKILKDTVDPHLSKGTQYLYFATFHLCS